MPWNPKALAKHFASGEDSGSLSTPDLPKKDAVGMYVVNDGCIGVSAGYDIVFVHGLRGSRVSTFSVGGIFWLKALLAKDLGQDRILTWGYDADIANVSSFASQESIHGHAETLLDDLAGLRGCITRPIIFVGHSLGGLVVKDVLIKAAMHKSHNRDMSHAAIYTGTKGVIFLGTPHRGSGKEKLGDLVANAASIGLRRPNKQLLQSLRQNSHILEKQRDDFVTISNKMSIRCVREEIPTSVGMIVPEFSAAYDGFNVTKGAIHADHVNMVKFKSREDAGYQKILSWLKLLTSEAKPAIVPDTPDAADAADGDKYSSNPTPWLHMAAACTIPGYLERVLRDIPRGTLLKALNVRDEQNRTPLVMAIISSMPQNVRLLIRAGADPNTPSEIIPGKADRPVFLAAGLGFAECLEALITEGKLDPNMKSQGAIGSTLLHAGVLNNRPDVVRKLLALGADPWVRESSDNGIGWTVFDLATAKKSKEILGILTEATSCTQQGHRLLTLS